MWKYESIFITQHISGELGWEEFSGEILDQYPVAEEMSSSLDEEAGLRFDHLEVLADNLESSFYLTLLIVR